MLSSAFCIVPTPKLLSQASRLIGCHLDIAPGGTLQMWRQSGPQLNRSSMLCQARHLWHLVIDDGLSMLNECLMMLNYWRWMMLDESLVMLTKTGQPFYLMVEGDHIAINRWWRYNLPLWSWMSWSTWMSVWLIAPPAGLSAIPLIGFLFSTSLPGSCPSHIAFHPCLSVFCRKLRWP